MDASSCDDWNKGRNCDHVVPTKGNGLVFQNLCKEDTSKIEHWRTRPPLAVPRTFPPDPKRQLIDSDSHGLGCPWMNTTSQNATGLSPPTAQRYSEALGPPLPRKLYLISQPGKEAYMQFTLEGIKRAALVLGGFNKKNLHEEVEVCFRCMTRVDTHWP